MIWNQLSSTNKEYAFSPITVCNQALSTMHSWLQLWLPINVQTVDQIISSHMSTYVRVFLSIHTLHRSWSTYGPQSTINLCESISEHVFLVRCNCSQLCECVYVTIRLWQTQLRDVHPLHLSGRYCLFFSSLLFFYQWNQSPMHFIRQQNRVHDARHQRKVEVAKHWSIEGICRYIIDDKMLAPESDYPLHLVAIRHTPFFFQVWICVFV